MLRTDPHAIAGELAEILTGQIADADTWLTFSRRFTELIPGTKTVFFANDTVSGREIPTIPCGFEEKHINEFIEYYWKCSPWTAMNFNLKLFTPQRTELCAPVSSFANSEFYNDYLARIGESDAATAMKIWGDAQRNAEFAVHYAATRDERLAKVLDPVLRALGPVMNDALTVMRVRIEETNAVKRRTIVDAMVDPAFIVGRNGRVLAVNAAGQKLAQDEDLIRITAGDRLELRDPAVMATVTEVIQSMIRGERMAAGNELTRFGPPGRLHTLTAFPMATQFSHGLGVLMPSEACVLLIIRPLLMNVEPSDLLRERFGVTAAEARLALDLVTGDALAAVARRRGISYETARTQLKSIFAKLDVHRQSELVAKVIACCAPFL